MIFKCIVIAAFSLSVAYSQEDGVNAQIVALKSGNRDLIVVGARQLAKRGKDAEPALAALIDLFGDYKVDSHNIRVAPACASAVAAIGKPAVPSVLAAMRSKSDDIFLSATIALREMKGGPPSEALPLLVNELKTANGRRLRVAVTFAADFKGHGKELTAHLERGFLDKQMHTRISACQTAASFGNSAEAARPKLIGMLKKGVTSVRGQAALALGKLGGEKLDETIKALIDATTDRQDTVRDRAVKALGELGPSAKSALPHLRNLLGDKKYRNRIQTGLSITHIGGHSQDVLRVFTELTASRTYELDALAAIGSLGSKAKSTGPKLAKMLDSEDPDKRLMIVRTLSDIGFGDDIRKQLLNIASDDADAEVKTEAQKALRKDKQSRTKK